MGEKYKMEYIIPENRVGDERKTMVDLCLDILCDEVIYDEHKITMIIDDSVPNRAIEETLKLYTKL